MAADVDIANAALTKLGAGRITALTDDNDRARVMNARYADVRDAELRRHRWRFAMTRASLPALSSTPLFGYAREFQLPVDYLRLVSIGEYDVGLDMSDYRNAPTALYSIEGGKVLTSLTAPLAIRYAKRVTDVSAMDPAFREAFACRLAMETAERITQDSTKRRLAFGEYKEAIREAVRANAIEAAPEYPSDGEWVMARTM